jgi:arylsulfatase A-like enzyme/Flp pilus assembly protein TadD
MDKRRRSVLQAVSFFFPAFLLILSGPVAAADALAKPVRNLLLISIDTLRADYLGCYGGTEARTPAADSLAAAGIIFSRAFAHNPLTLPSHANILTGMTALIHGVHENLGFRLPADTPTLAAHLKSAGYQTAAFIGAFPLDSRFGLDRGFELYDDFYGEKKSRGAFFFTERKGEEVVSRAEQWIGTRKSEPWFAFVHLFDPHQPYDPPPPFKEQYAANLYAGEVAYTDACLSRLFRFLEAAGLSDRTLIVLTADHGESLGEHGEDTHGYFAYNSTLQVPLIFRSPGLIRGGKTIAQAVSHIDIFPTACDLLGVRKPSGLDGQSLAPLLEGGKLGERPIYFESLSAYYNRNWAPLRGIVESGYKYIDLPLPELYDLREDFGEGANIATVENIQVYRKTLAGLVERAGPGGRAARRPESGAAVQAMKSLGYLSGGGGPEKTRFTAADDLKTLLPLQQKLSQATALFADGQSRRAVEILESLVVERKDFAAAYDYLANIHYQAGDPKKAAEVLEKGTSACPGNAQLMSMLGMYLTESGRAGDAVQVLERASSLNPEDAETWNYLGVALWRAGQFDEAEDNYRKSLALDADYASAWNNLGSLFLSRNDPDQALAHFKKAASFDPSLASVWNGQGVALNLKGDLDAAIVNWEKAVSLEPGHQLALFNLGTALVKKNRLKEALPYLEKYLRVAPVADPDREKIVQLVNAIKKRNSQDHE